MTPEKQPRSTHGSKPVIAIDRYRDNALIDACGEILSPHQTAARLTYLPPRPSANDLGLPAHLRLHAPLDLWRLRLPTPAGLAFAQSLDIMIRQGYVDRCPLDPATWRRIYERGAFESALRSIQLGASVVGLSGTGKTSAIEGALALKPQVVVHERFPHLIGPVQQLIWLKLDVPSSGTLAELVLAFAYAADRALNTNYASQLGKGRERADSMARRWLTLIESHFPGVLVLDELQNLFKIETKAVRRAERHFHDGPVLRIKDDDALKFILTIMNSSKIPIVVCSTPDGISALGTRTSTSQRLVTNGYHDFPHAASSDDEFFRKVFFPQLQNYRWLPEGLTNSTEMRNLFYRLTAGIPRIGVALWVHANQRAISRHALRLADEDFQHAASHALAPLAPAVQALLSGDPARMRRYEDLLPSK